MMYTCTGTVTVFTHPYVLYYLGFLLNNSVSNGTLKLQQIAVRLTLLQTGTERSAEIKLSSFIGTDGSQRCRRASMRCTSSDQVMSERWGGVNHNNFKDCGGG
jgi:hypothetical protein